MCVYENEEDHSSISNAADALHAILEQRETNHESLTHATESLSALRSRIARARESHAEVGASERRLQKTETDAEENLQQIEQRIIEAKIEAVQVFEERDQVARDLSRAKKAVDEIDAIEKSDAADEEPTDLREINGNSDNPANSTDFSNLQTHHRLTELMEERAKTEVDQLRSVEAEILSTSGEIEALRKHRKELEEKLQAAQAEW